MKKLDTKTLKTVSGGTSCYTPKSSCHDSCGSKKSKRGC